ncbi:MAG: LysR family transcriptional regulator [Firmicutes bacterium]|nr:LysR family transcriptional regulator [Bacillota bacterium]
MMTQLEIEAFLYITKYGSISAAADKLYVTQSALSRRIRSLETQLGYTLFSRGKGIRGIELTQEGRAFIPLAQQWIHLYQEAVSLTDFKENPILNVGSVLSVSTYLLPNALRNFLKHPQGFHLCFHNYHSVDAYAQMESGMIDVALVSDEMYSRTVTTAPAFQEPFVYVCGKDGQPADVMTPELLPPKKEIRLPWNPGYDIWHDRHFKPSIYPKVNLDQMSLLEDFLTEDNWAIVPLSVSARIRRQDVQIRPLENGPDDIMVYLLTLPSLTGMKKEMVEIFLELLDQELKYVSGIRSFL